MSTPAESQPGIQELAVSAIDQVVVDGLVDGAERRVRVGVLRRIAFDETVVLDDDQFREFCDGLADDMRYVDRIRSMYSFQPIVRPESTATASLIAIVGGTALCSAQEREAATHLMDYFANTVYEHGSRTGGILSLREVSGALKTGGIENISYQEFGAFQRFMRQDPRFYPIDDGRIVLTEAFRGDAGELVELPRIEDVAGAVEQALPYLLTDPHGVFTKGVLLGTMKSLARACVRRDQLEEVYRQLRLSPHVEVLEDGRYRLIRDDLSVSDKSSQEEPEPQLSFEARVRAVRGRMQPKPGSGRRVGKRIVDMSIDPGQTEH